MLVTRFILGRQIHVFVQEDRVFCNNHLDELEHGSMTSVLSWLILRIRPNVVCLLFPHRSEWLSRRTATRNLRRARRVHLEAVLHTSLYVYGLCPLTLSGSNPVNTKHSLGAIASNVKLQGDTASVFTQQQYVYGIRR